MKIVLFGQKSFGTAVARTITEAGHTIVAVFGPRNGEPVDPLRRWAMEEQVECLELVPGSLHAGIDLIVCAHNHAYIPKQIREAARLGAINYHPSLLPRHRGRDAIEWTIRMHDAVAGGTVYWLDDGADTGPIAAQEWCWVEPGWDASTLWREKLFSMGVRLISRVLHNIEHGHIVRMPQNGRVATFEPAITHSRLAGQSHRPTRSQPLQDEDLQGLAAV